MRDVLRCPHCGFERSFGRGVRRVHSSVCGICVENSDWCIPLPAPTLLQADRDAIADLELELALERLKARFPQGST